MTTLVQLLIAAVFGTIAGFLTNMIGAADPWPILIGVIVFLAIMGVCVVVVDGDLFD